MSRPSALTPVERRASRTATGQMLMAGIGSADQFTMRWPRFAACAWFALFLVGGLFFAAGESIGCSENLDPRTTRESLCTSTLGLDDFGSAGQVVYGYPPAISFVVAMTIPRAMTTRHARRNPHVVG